MVNIAIKNILCPVDFSESADHMLNYAVAFAQAYNATLRLLHVAQPPMLSIPGDPMVPEFSSEVLEDVMSASERRLETIAERFRDTVPAVVTTVASGSAFVEIIKAARREAVDIIVIGTHGRTGLAHVMIGSVAEKVVRGAPCPVLTVKHPEHEFVQP